MSKQRHSSHDLHQTTASRRDFQGFYALKDLGLQMLFEYECASVSILRKSREEIL